MKLTAFIAPIVHYSAPVIKLIGNNKIDLFCKEFVLSTLQRMEKTRPKVLILGAGFAGLNIARRMAKTAVGGQTNYFEMTKVRENGFSLKIFGDAAEIRNHILSSFKKAMMEEDPAKRLALMIVVIGGGAPAELIRYVLVKDFREGVKESFRVLLCEAGERLLPEMPEDLAEEAARILKHKGVEIPFNSSIKDLTGEEIAAKNLFRQLSGKPQSAFEYKNPGTLATIGKNAAVA